MVIFLKKTLGLVKQCKTRGCEWTAVQAVPRHGTDFQTMMSSPGLGRLYGTPLLLRQNPPEFFNKNPQVRTPHVCSNFWLDTQKCSKHHGVVQKCGIHRQ